MATSTSQQNGSGHKQKKEAGPDTPSKSYLAMKPKWDLISALLGGTEAMRAAGEEYLPKHRREFSDDYKERLRTNVLANYFEWTLDGLVSKPFAEQPKIEDVPTTMEDILDNVDLQGNDAGVFLRNWFREGYAKAFSHVLVDFPRVKPREDGQPRTLDDDRRDGVRPYWVHVCPENVIFAHSEMVNGVEVLTQVRILEEETVVEGWEEICIQRIRVLRPGSVELYRLDPRSKKWALEDEWDTGIPVVPFVTFYANGRDDLMCAKPPLLDLAYLNVAHWQSSSDQRNVLTVARFPLLAGAGVTTEDSNGLEVGPNRLLTTTDPQGKFYYVEHTGAAIEAGRKDLEALEAQMSGYGATFLKAQTGTQTATARALDSAEAISPLQATTVVFEDAVEQVLDLTAMWMKQEAEIKVEFNKEFGLTLGDQAGLDVLFKTRQAKDISRKAYLDELKRRALLNSDYDAEADQEEIDEEAANGAAGLDLDPAQAGQTDPEDQLPAKTGNPPPAGGE